MSLDLREQVVDKAVPRERPYRRVPVAVQCMFVLAAFFRAEAVSHAQEERVADSKDRTATKARAAAVLRKESNSLYDIARRQSEKHKLCGKYEAQKGDTTTKSFDFVDASHVVVDTMGHETTRRYLIANDRIIVHADTDLFDLRIAAPTRLVGVDRWTKGVVYWFRRKGDVCGPISERNATVMRQTTCYHVGISLQAQRKMDLATLQYERCCTVEDDPVSCNKLGLMTEMVGKRPDQAATWYQRACDRGYGGGCSNLAAYHARAGQPDRATLLYTKACRELDFIAACSKLSERPTP